jgi:manganese-dependent inorganic pyrophosphatase
MPLYIFGHRNPDTDAICSAIAYAEFLRQTGQPQAVPARCGEVSVRTAYALEQAGVDHPQLIMDVRPTAADVCRREVISARLEENLLGPYRRLRANELRSMPVLTPEGTVAGMLSLTKMLHTLMPEGDDAVSARQITTSLQRICAVLEGRFQFCHEAQSELNLVITVAAFSLEAFRERITTYKPEKLVVILGDRVDVQQAAIEYGVHCLIVTGGHTVSEEMLELAERHKVAVLGSPHDTATTTLLIKFARKLETAMRKKFISFAENTPLRQVMVTVRESSQTLFPVVNAKGWLTGVLSKSDFVSPPARKLVLVDHNEFTQAVAGASEAEIVEVIDHHKLGGGLSTRHPIRFINEPLGSTCTIVARMYRDRGMTPSPAIAMCMAAGMISDTLLLTSPTTTEVDKEIFEWLQEIAGRDLREFAANFFAAGSLLQNSPLEEVVRADCKEYEEEGWRIGVAQVEEQGLDYFWEKEDALRDALDEMRKEKGLDFAALLITDITRHYSLLLVAGDERIIAKIDYPRFNETLFELVDVVSRKKQLLPHLIWLLSKVPREG